MCAKSVLCAPSTAPSMDNSIFRSEDKKLNSSHRHCVEDDELEVDRFRDQLGSCHGWSRSAERHCKCSFLHAHAFRNSRCLWRLLVLRTMFSLCDVMTLWLRCNSVPCDNFAFRNVVLVHPGSSRHSDIFQNGVKLFHFSPPGTASSRHSCQRVCRVLIPRSNTVLWN